GVKLDDLETNHFILIHGGGFGAWCWYKTIALLEEDGFKVTAIDLAGCGINSCNINSIASLSQYVKPLTDVLEKLPTGEKVILVGHDFGGACISYAMEQFPSKISKAVFLSAAMLTNGQSTLDMFSLQAGQSDLMRKAQIFIYTNGNEHPPTAIDLDKSLLKDLLFNQSPSKDVALASVSMRSIPFAPVLEKLSLSDGNYGSVRRYYIETLEDNAIPLALQEHMINSSPPEKVYRLKDVARSVFFFLFFTVSLLLLLAAASATASSGNVTSGFGYGGCGSGDTVGECITAVVEDEEGVEAVVRRILQQQRRKLSYKALQKQPTCNGKIAGNCIGTANRRNARCTYYNRCKRAT
uniref:AB hydrolase-1 domain-containing protein n=1 Tax=Brassica oleracea var. oleracea TaxID=109376 RepID=A0A0D3AWN7_BRAOL